VLAQLDLVIGSVHVAFKQSRSEMTRRICRALAHPRVHVLGHPTGRLIGERDPYAVDIDEVLRTARRYDKAMEINSYPDRLDLNDAHARRAHELGVRVAVSTDTHMLDHLDFMELGVATARRGWTETPQVVNTWSASKLLAWLRAERAAPPRAAHGR
jgi:DNA polymerase (family 10)